MFRKRKRIGNESIVLDNAVNMTPFVDLLFTIVIILLIPNQVMFGNIQVDIPKGKAEIVVIEKEPIAVFIKSDGSIFVGEEEIKVNQLKDRISELTMKDYKTKIFVIGDRQNLYGRIISIVSSLNDAGFKDVVLVTDLNVDLK